MRMCAQISVLVELFTTLRNADKNPEIPKHLKINGTKIVILLPTIR